MTRSGPGPKSESQSFGSADGHRRSPGPVQDREREPQAGNNGLVSASRAAPTTSSRSGYTAAGQLSAESIRLAHQAWADEQEIVTRCAFCDWRHEGPAGAGREAALEHRRAEHPEACIVRPRRTRRITKRKLRSAGEEEQIRVDAAEARRVRFEREQAEMLAKVERGLARERAAASALDATTLGV